MPRIIVTADSSPFEPDAGAPVLLDERVDSVHLASRHAALQLVERLQWAIGDAEAARPSARRLAAAA
jgi:hypothetical protein